MALDRAGRPVLAQAVLEDRLAVIAIRRRPLASWIHDGVFRIPGTRHRDRRTQREAVRAPWSRCFVVGVGHHHALREVPEVCAPRSKAAVLILIVVRALYARHIHCWPWVVIVRELVRAADRIARLNGVRVVVTSHAIAHGYITRVLRAMDTRVVIVRSHRIVVVRSRIRAAVSPPFALTRCSEGAPLLLLARILFRKT